jgi:hypothetical protein
MAETKLKTFRLRIDTSLLDGGNTRLIVTAPSFDDLISLLCQDGHFHWAIKHLFVGALGIHCLGEDKADPLLDTIIQWDQITK